MSTPILLTLGLSFGPSLGPAAPPVHPVIAQEADVGARIEECGEDVTKLLALAKELKSNAKFADARKVMERVVEIDAENEEARKSLGHQKYDGQWFTSSVALMQYRRAEEKKMLEQGLVRLNNDWVPTTDAPYMRMGWVKDGDGWVNPYDLAMREEAAKHAEEGWVCQDATWVPPAESSKIEEGLWKCGEQWLSLEDANAYHAQLGQWWQIPSEHFVVLSTCPRDYAEVAGAWADYVYPNLVRAFGLEPERKPEVVVLDNISQYNAFANGDQAAQRPPAEAAGYSTLHHAFFAEIFADGTVQPPRYRGCGVGFWDGESANLSAWGPHSIRHAAAQSYAEVIDPSWNEVSMMVSNPQRGFQEAAFWGEKKIPRWLRYGVAAYVERYYYDPNAEDPWALRSWAIDQLRQQGGVRPFDQIFAFTLDLNAIPQSTKLIQEAGLVVSFVLDGECEPVVAAHQAWRTKLMAGGDGQAALEALQKAIVEHDEEFRDFAKL